MRALAAALVFSVALEGCATAPGLSLSPEAVAASPWRAVDAETGKIIDAAQLEHLAKDFPDSSSVRLRLLNAQIDAEDWEAVLASLGWLAARGYVFSAATREELPLLAGPSHSEAVRSLLLAPGVSTAHSKLYATIPAEAGLVESVLANLGGGKIAVTSVTDHSVWMIGSAGDFEAIRPAGAGNLSGIVFDVARSTIWAASGAIADKDNSGFRGLVEIVPGRAKGKRVPTPDGASISDLHRAQDGTIYASAPLTGGIYRLSPASQAFEVLVPAGVLRSPQGLATSADGRKLYVSDYRYGIAIVNLASGEASRLSTKLPITLDGIDGIWRRGDELIAIQNGMKPMRIVGLKLSRDGTSVVSHRILEQAHPGWTEPLSGHFDGGALYYVANGQWDRSEGGKGFEPTKIYHLKVGPAEDAH